ERAEGVEGFGVVRQALGTLNVPRRHVVGTGIAENESQSLSHRDPTTLPTHHDRKLGLVVHLLRLDRIANSGSIADHAGRWLEEDSRPLRDRRPELGGVIGVVTPDRHDLARLNGGNRSTSWSGYC